MNHLATARFWRCYRALPAAVRKLADRSFGLLKADANESAAGQEAVGAVCLPTAIDEGRTATPRLTPRRQLAMLAQPAN